MRQGLPICDYEVILKRDWRRDERKIMAAVAEKLGFPVFVKPANLGSSVGISKVRTCEELAGAMRLAAEYDTKIIVERGITGRELECAVLGNEAPIA